MGLLSDLLNTATGRDKVETREFIRPGFFSGEPKTHIHASRVTRHWDGSATVTEAHTGAKHELPAQSIRWIGPSVRVETGEY